ncbi:MAG: hypothetical protein ACXV4A_03860 [Actinomycetes bacterium]
MSTCITCGTELHPERAEKYDYCLAPECQAKNARGLTMVAVGVNKSAEQFQVLDDGTRQAMASGRYQDQRRASFGTPATPSPADPREPGRGRSDVPAQRPSPRPAAQPARRRTWSQRQQNLALIYHEQGMRPDDIAEKLGLSSYTVTQILLAARPRRTR